MQGARWSLLICLPHLQKLVTVEAKQTTSVLEVKKSVLDHSFQNVPKKMLEKERRVRRQDEDSGERHGNECFSKWQTSQIQPTLFDPKTYETAVRLFSKYYYKRFVNI